MKHFASPEFWIAYRRLPAHVRALADKNFALLKSDPRHPSLHFKQIGRYRSARVGLRFRALAVEIDDGLRSSRYAGWDAVARQRQARVRMTGRAPYKRS